MCAGAHNASEEQPFGQATQSALSGRYFARMSFERYRERNGRVAAKTVLLEGSDKLERGAGAGGVASSGNGE